MVVTPRPSARLRQGPRAARQGGTAGGVRVGRALPAALLVLLAACSTPPRGPGVDGPPVQMPAGADTAVEPVPRVETVRAGGPNKPYEVAGRWYTPLVGDRAWPESGLASWYGHKFHGRPTASGEVYDMFAFTAAHRTLPIPSYALVRNPANGRELVVRINDRGPFHDERIVDLSWAAARRLGVLGGVAPVSLRRITHAEILAGAWSSPGALADRGPAAGDLDPLQDWLIRRGEAGRGDAPPPDAPPAAAAAPREGGFWLQLAAFRQVDAARSLRDRLAREWPWLASVLALVDEGGTVRVQAGPWATREQAEAVARRVRESPQALAPLVFERR